MKQHFSLLGSIPGGGMHHHAWSANDNRNNSDHLRIYTFVDQPVAGNSFEARHRERIRETTPDRSIRKVPSLYYSAFLVPTYK